jgi:glycosyltransferase involved in cell wall biosynthesis
LNIFKAADFKYIFHFNNDFSGSPIALRNQLLRNDSINYMILTNSVGGSLDDLNVTYVFNKTYKSKIMILLSLIYFYFYACFFLLNKNRKAKLIANTIMLSPLCFLVNIVFWKKPILLIHEFRLNSNFLNFVCKSFMLVSSYVPVCVSLFQKNTFSKYFRLQKAAVQHNVLSLELASMAKQYRSNGYRSRNRVLFVGSTKSYKGFNTFVKLSQSLSGVKFTAILSDEPRADMGTVEVHVRPSIKEIGELYSESLVVLNLSLINEWLETFGLTILEGSSFGCITITPEAGGFRDFVKPEWSLAVDTSDFASVEAAIRYVLQEDNWLVMNNNLITDLEDPNSIIFDMV